MRKPNSKIDLLYIFHIIHPRNRSEAFSHFVSEENTPRGLVARQTFMVAKLQQNTTLIKICIKTNNLTPNSTNLSQRQHCLPVNFNNFIFSSTIFSQLQLHKLLNFNIVISLKINGKKSTQKKFFCCWINTCSYPIFTT